MARHEPLYQQAGVYQAFQDRSLIATIWPQGGVLNGTVTTVTGTMNVQIAPGTVVVVMTAGNGCAVCWWDANEIVTLAASPPTGQSRIDVIVCQVRDAAVDAGQYNDFIFAAVTGTATTGTPTVPTIPANSYAIANITVPGNVTNLNTALISPVGTSLQGGGSGGMPVGGTMEWWSDTLPNTPGMTWLFMDGSTVTNGVLLYPALAAVYPNWVSGNNLVLPQTKQKFLMGAAVGGSGGPAVGTTGGSATPTLTTGMIPQFSNIALSISNPAHGHGLNWSDPGHSHSQAPQTCVNYGSTQGLSTYSVASQALYSNVYSTYGSGTGIGASIQNGTQGTSGTVTFGSASPAAVPLPAWVACHKVIRAA